MNTIVSPSNQRVPKKGLFYAVCGLFALLVLQSCTAAAFDRAQPPKSKLEKTFPKPFSGNWVATELSEHFYVDKISFDKTTITYEMTALSPDNPASLTLTKDSVELRKMQKDYVFNVAGDGIWICFVLRQPSKNKLEIYGFDESAKQYVERYETEDTEQGIVFIKYYPTEAEWEKLFRSEALKKVATYERTK